MKRKHEKVIHTLIRPPTFTFRAGNPTKFVLYVYHPVLGQTKQRAHEPLWERRFCDSYNKRPNHTLTRALVRLENYSDRDPPYRFTERDLAPESNSYSLDPFSRLKERRKERTVLKSRRAPRGATSSQSNLSFERGEGFSAPNFTCRHIWKRRDYLPCKRFENILGGEIFLSVLFLFFRNLFFFLLLQHRSPNKPEH